MSSAEKVLVILTGGTMDAEPYGSGKPYEATMLSSSLVPSALAELKKEKPDLPDCDVKDGPLFADSKKFKPSDIRSIAEMIIKEGNKKVIITHGTDWMAHNARFLDKMLKELAGEDHEYKVIFTGAMKPLSEGREISDGYRNLRDSLTAFDINKPGVMMVMGGAIMNPYKTTKHRITNESGQPEYTHFREWKIGKGSDSPTR